MLDKIRLFIVFKLLRKERKTMAVIYATLIVKGLRTFDSVPDILKPQVKEILDALEVPVPEAE